MKDVFVSYRRSDSSDVTGRIYDHLKARLGPEHLFKDVDSIPLGKDFRRVIADAVGGCKVVLAVIGRDWLTAQDRHGNTRIKDEDDYVSIELTTALQRGIPVIPVLVEQVEMPSPEDLPERLKELAYRNATHVRPDPDFLGDIERLASQIAEYIGDGPSPRPARPWPSKPVFLSIIAGSIGLVIAAVATYRFAGAGGRPAGPGAGEARGQIGEPRPHEGPAFAEIRPELVRPKQREIIDRFPRITELEWKAVPGATRDQVEIQIDTESGDWVGTRVHEILGEGRSQVVLPPVAVTQPELTVDLIGANTYRWRVTGLDESGHQTAPSEWRLFSHQR